MGLGAWVLVYHPVSSKPDTPHIAHLPGIKGYEILRVDLSVEEVIAAYRQLIKIEKSFVGCQNRILKLGRFFTARLIRLLLTWRW